jgi:hypothetical protein
MGINIEVLPINDQQSKQKGYTSQRIILVGELGGLIFLKVLCVP